MESERLERRLLQWSNQVTGAWARMVGWAEKWSDSGYILEVEPRRLADGLESQGQSKDWGWERGGGCVCVCTSSMCLPRARLGFYHLPQNL